MSSLLRALTLLPLALLLFCLPLCTQAHMQMSSPYPLRSALDPAVPEQYKDYSMTSPLNSDGSDAPCKNHQLTDMNPQAYDVKATYQAGSPYQLTLAGSATHEGGSCQISMSYDNGASFKVIQSLIGGCPLDTTLNFTIPSFAPSSSSALLSWTWFNLVGSREMYQNCARVQIQGTPSQRYRRMAYRRQTSMDQLPDMFACNINNGCQTIENAEVVFPDPGPNVVYGQDGVTPNPGPGFVISGSNSTSTTTSLIPTSTTTSLASTFFLTTTTSSVPFPVSNSTLSVGSTVTETSDSTSSALTTSSSLSSSTAPPTTTTSSSTVQQFQPVTVTITVTVTASPGGTPTTILSTIVTSIPITSTSAASSTSLLARDTTLSSSGKLTTLIIAAPSSSSTTLPSSCTPVTLACNSPSTFSQCVSSGKYVYMGSVAAGMQCSNGQVIRPNAGACTGNGQIFCNGSNAFYICDQGGLINMGPVAPGTVCRNGAIVAA